ncbi:MAG: hypothetical protein V4584_11780 [Verrucomicrobiota bacterium]
MNSSLFTDRRANGLLNRVREDVSHLRDDIGSLLSHTTKKTLPNGARELADQAKHQFAAGSAYAASRFRDLRSQPPRQSASWIGGALVVGLLAYGVYALCQNSCQNRRIADADQFEPEDEVTG